MANFNWKEVSVSGGGDRMDYYWPGKVADRKEGMNVIGRYKETRNVPNQSGGTQKLHVVKDQEGKLVGVNGSYVLDESFETIPVDSVVRVTYLGQEYNAKSQHKLNRFQVDVADGSPQDGEPAETVTEAKEKEAKEEKKSITIDEIPF